MDDKFGESTEEDDVTGTGRGESEIERLHALRLTVRNKQGAGSRDKMKHIERNDQLFVTRMM